MAIRFFSDPVRVLSFGRDPIQVLLIRSDPVPVLSIRSDPIRSRFCKRPCIHKNCKHMGKKYKGWIIMFMATTFQTFRQFNNEVSPTARALLSLPGIRPGFQEMLR